MHHQSHHGVRSTVMIDLAVVDVSRVGPHAHHAADIRLARATARRAALDRLAMRLRSRLRRRPGPRRPITPQGPVPIAH